MSRKIDPEYLKEIEEREKHINPELLKARREPNTPEYIRKKGYSLGYYDGKNGNENLYKIDKLNSSFSSIYFILGYVEGFETAINDLSN